MREKSVISEFILTFLVGLIGLIFPLEAHAEDPKVEFNAQFEPATVRVGETTVLNIEATVPKGYHFYSMTKVEGGPLRFRVKYDEATFEGLGEWHAPTPHVELDPNFNKTVEYYEGKVVHQRAFKIKAGEAGEGSQEVAVKGQFCDEHQCHYIREKLSVPLTIEAGDARADRSEAAALEGEAFPPDRPAPAGDGSAEAGSHAEESKGEGKDKEGNLPLGDGLFGYLAIAFLAGLGALVTPCVFPMIPITISFFSKFAEVSMKRSVTMATIYAVSIIGTFTLIGVVVSLAFGAVGMQAISASIGFNVFLGLLLFVFAFNLFGLFEIQVPSWLIARSSQKEHELTSDGDSVMRQAAGVFFMALTFTLVSFTCTVGFIGVVLAEAAKGNWFYPAIGMLSFACAFATPFFFLAIFPTWANKLQGKAGDWMVAVKAVLGFIELSMAFKFLSNVDLLKNWGLVTRPLVLAFWTGIFLCAALYLIRVIRLPHDDDSKVVGPIRMFIGMCFFAVSAFSMVHIPTTKSLGGWIDGWLPPAIYPGQEAAHGGGEGGGGGDGHLPPPMKDDIEGGMAKAKAENRPLFIDFTGYTCTNCRYMEMSIFPQAQVKPHLLEMVRVESYTDCEEEVCETQRDYQVNRFETAALPFYAIINPHTDEILETFASSTNDADEFAAFLKKGLAAFDKVKPKDAAPAPSEKVGEKAAEGDKGEPADAHAAKEGEGHSEFADLPLDLATEGKAIEMTFPELENGAEFKLSSLRGQWAFVNFWASWCAPCKKELKGDFPGALASAPHIKLVTVAFDGDETKEEALKFAREIDLLKHPTLQGGEDIEEAGLDEAFEVTASLPISYLIHPDGYIAWSRKGSIDEALMKRLFAKTSAN